MIREELQKEKQNLTETLSVIDENLKIQEGELKSYNESYEQLLSYISENFAVMDDSEKVTENELLAKNIQPIENAERIIERLRRQRTSPYFGRFDFAEENEQATQFYIGTFNLFGEKRSAPYVYDWRAPISTLFYDSGLGNVSYVSPSGEIKGKVSLKRQYKIVDSKLKLCFNTNERVGDEVLEEALAMNSSDKMKNIVATLQSEQNKIVRKQGCNLLIQGVAGSGKTSIALHKVAYLLYQDRDKLKSGDILIVSPNKIFSEFISSVLPELGEENIEETSIEKIFAKELQPFLNEKIEKKEEMQEELLNSPERREEVTVKYSAEFLDKLLIFAESYLVAHFTPTDFVVGKTKISKEVIDKLYHETYRSKTPAIRILWIADYIAEKLGLGDAGTGTTQRIINLLYPMFDNMELTSLYHEFLHGEGMHFELSQKDKIQYEDAGALLILKHYLLGIETRPEIKYLIVDEMQDYSFCEFYILSQIFSCRKIVLGDIYQNAYIKRDKDFLYKLKTFVGAKEIINLSTCYRSSFEIATYASTFLPKNTLFPIPRHSGDVEKYGVRSQKTLLKKLEDIVNNLREQHSGYRIAILTHTQKKAEELFSNLSNLEELQLLSASSTTTSKMIIAPISVVKGLEYDAVVLCNFKEDKSANDVTKRLNFVGVTRALHRLAVINIAKE